MRRYHFDLVDTYTVTDATGAVLENDAQAKHVALKLAHDVRQHRPELLGQGYEVLVRTEDGDEIIREAIDLPSTKT
jgi:hypothetical protein